MEQRKEEEKEEEEEGSVLKEPADQRREEEEDSVLKAPTDQRREEEEDSVLKEATEDQQRDEESSEEPAGRRSEEPTDQHKEAERSSDEESEAASTLFVHPCSLLRYLVRAFTCCLGMPDSLGGSSTAKRGAGAVAPASVDSSPDGDEADRSAGATTTVTGFYMQEVITRAFAVRRPRPPSGNPREGSGGNGGHHH